MTPFALSAIKYGLLILVYLFIWRAVKRVVSDVRTQSPGRRKKGERGAEPSTPQTASIVVVHEPDGAKPRTFKLAASMLVGRAPECDIKVDDTYASQQHARLFGRAGRLVRGGPGLDERHVRERAAAGRAGARAARRQDPRGHHRRWSCSGEAAGRVATDIGRVREKQRGLAAGRAAAVRGRRRDGRPQGRRGRLAARARDDRGRAPHGGRLARERSVDANGPVFERSQSDRGGRHGHDVTAVVGEGNVGACSRTWRQPRLPTARRGSSPAHRRPHARAADGEDRRDHRGRGRGPPAPQRDDARARHRARGRASTRRRGLIDGDRLLLCSDGLTDGDRGADRRDPRPSPNPQHAADRLVRAANRAGGVDNITVVVIDVQARRTGGTEAAAPGADRSRAAGGCCACRPERARWALLEPRRSPSSGCALRGPAVVRRGNPAAAWPCSAGSRPSSRAGFSHPVDITEYRLPAPRPARSTRICRRASPPTTARPP